MKDQKRILSPTEWCQRHHEEMKNAFLDAAQQIIREEDVYAQS